MLRRYEFGDLKVAQRGQSTLYCTECEKPLTRYNEKILLKGNGAQCPICGDAQVFYDTFGEEIGVRVRPDCAQYLVDSPREWWHGTTRNPWQPASDMFIHAGTKYAANQIVKWSTLERKHFYRIRLKPHVQYAPGFYYDDNRWPHRAGRKYEQITFNVGPSDGIAFRYINRAESPGSVSVLVQFGDVEIVRHVDGAGNPVLGSL